MIDLGDFEPQATAGPTRLRDGTVNLGRVLTTEELRDEAVRAMTTEFSKRVAGKRVQDPAEARMRVAWAPDNVTVLIIRFSIEHIEGEPVYIPDMIQEQTEAGSEIRTTPEDRLRILTSEVRHLHESKML